MARVSRSQRLMLYDESKLKLINPESRKLLQAYKKDMMLRELSDKTILNYMNDLHQWLIYVLDNQDNRSVLELDEDDLTDFFFYCKEQGNHTNRMKRRNSSISAFYKYLRKKRKIAENPMEFVDRPIKTTPVVQQTFLTKEQVEEMKQKLSDEGNLTLELYALLSLSTMARVNAISNIKWKQVDYSTRTIKDVLEKEGNYVTLFFSRECALKMMKLQDFRDLYGIEDGGYIFFGIDRKTGRPAPISTQTLGRWCKKIGKMIDVPSLHPHDFRHSGSQLLKLAGMPLEEISEFLHHQSTDTTQKYYLQKDTNRMRDAKDRYET